MKRIFWLFWLFSMHHLAYSEDDGFKMIDLIQAQEISQSDTTLPPKGFTHVEKIQRDLSHPGKSPIMINFKEVFFGAPTIYSILGLLSISSLGLCLYLLLSFRTSQSLPQEDLNALHRFFEKGECSTALAYCQKRDSLFARMMALAIASKNQGEKKMVETMRDEGKRLSAHFWQKIGLLNDIAVIAPMLGLLGTVIGMFYAFYDINRSMESISTLFDGLGISVGTTAFGLIVAILSIALYSILKYRLIHLLNMAETEAIACLKKVPHDSHS